MAADDSDFYTPKEIAPKLQLHYHTFLRHIRNKHPCLRGLPVKRFGRSIRIPKAPYAKWAGIR